MFRILMQVALFLSDDPSEIEEKINDWFLDNPDISVRFISQSETVTNNVGSEDWTVTITIWYENVEEVNENTIQE